MSGPITIGRRKIELIYVVLFSIAFITRLGNSTTPNYFIRYILCCVWIYLALFQFMKHDFKLKEHKSEVIFYFKLFMKPYILLIFYNVFLFVSKHNDLIFLGRCASDLGSMVITISAVFATVYLLEERALKCTISTVVINFSIVLIYNLIETGPAVLLRVLQTFVRNTEVINPFEVHDLTFAVGILFILYIYFEDRLGVRELKISFMAIIIMLAGFKRIQFIAILLIIVYMFLMGWINENKRYKVMLYTGYAMLLVCFAFVWLIDSGTLVLLCNKFGINTMGRLAFYSWISTYGDFNISYLGIGLGRSSKMMNLYTGWSIATIHSDILRMFVEIGFIGFLLWAWYYLVDCYKKICKRFSNKDGELYFILTLYLFMLHFTDNTVTYFVTQYTYMLVVTIYTIYKKNPIGKRI